MVDIKITQPDSVVLKIECDRSLAKELNGYFTFTVPNFQYTPAFKKRLWDGKIRLFNLFNQTVYAGLLDRVIKFAKDRSMHGNMFLLFILFLIQKPLKALYNRFRCLQEASRFSLTIIR